MLAIHACARNRVLERLQSSEFHGRHCLSHQLPEGYRVEFRGDTAGIRSAYRPAGVKVVFLAPPVVSEAGREFTVSGGQRDINKDTVHRAARFGYGGR